MSIRNYRSKQETILSRTLLKIACQNFSQKVENIELFKKFRENSKSKNILECYFIYV